MNMRKIAKKEATLKRRCELIAILEGHTSANPIHGKALGQRLGCEKGADVTVRHLVNELRSEGVGICSSDDGYWLSNNAVELRQTIADLMGRMAKVQKAVNGLKMVLVNTDDKNVIHIEGDAFDISHLKLVKFERYA
jgi:biotin operon repressor